MLYRETVSDQLWNTLKILMKMEALNNFNLKTFFPPKPAQSPTECVPIEISVVFSMPN